MKRKVLFFVAIIALCGCGQSQKETIVGAWQISKVGYGKYSIPSCERNIIVFRKDGTFAYVNPNGHNTMSSYSVYNYTLSHKDAKWDIIPMTKDDIILRPKKEGKKSIIPCSQLTLKRNKDWKNDDWKRYY